MLECHPSAGVMKEGGEPAPVETAPATSEAYEFLSVDDLFLLAVASAQTKYQRPEFERLVAECFERFPKKFAMVHYPHWPDAVRVTRCWSRARGEHGYITGSSKAGFSLTPSGQLAATRAERKILGLRPRTRTTLRRTARVQDEAMVRHVKESHAYRVFRQTEGVDGISESDVRSLLGATMETSHRVLRQNLLNCLDVLRNAGDKSGVRFLELLSERIRGTLKGTK